METVGLRVQLGGGIRDMATIEGWLGKGVNRVIIGTAAVRDPALVKEAAKKFPKQRRGRPRCARRQGRGRRLGGDVGADACSTSRRRFEDAGVAAIIYTDVARDGMLKGINWTRRSRWPMPSRFR